MSPEAEWQDALPRPRPGFRLRAALFTTYETAQAELLVEHLLPSVLPLSRGLEAEPAARSLYFGELALHLNPLRGRLTVISSSPAQVPATSPADAPRDAYPWLWRYVTPLHTGAQGPATQHAKLWLLHWVGGEGDAGAPSEALEVVISSANLTLSSLQGQLQAGWRAFLPLETRATRASRSSWGPLPRFLEALGEAVGKEGAARTEAFVVLLSRCLCPPDVQLVASIPESLQREGEAGEWGVRALRKAAPQGVGRLRLKVCTPFVGEWRADTLGAWSRELGVESDAVSLVWLDNGHPWAVQAEGGGRWHLSRSSLAALEAAGVGLRRLGWAGEGLTSRFHPQHRADDARWSHAKLYLLQRGRTRRLLVTSANFSASAWGTGKAGPRNFELGVLVDGDWPVQPEEDFTAGHDIFTTDSIEAPGEAALTWAQATWDGETVSLVLRTAAVAGPAPDALVTGGGAGQGAAETRLKARRRAALLWEGTVPWTDGTRPPLKAHFTSGGSALEVPVLDLRAPEAFALTPLPEVPPEVAQALEDALLLESYGGPAVEADDVDGLLPPQDVSPETSSSAGTEDYTVEVFVTARTDFGVVDSWAQRLTEAASRGDGEWARVLLDGERLAALFERRAGGTGDLSTRLPARLVAEEFRWRLGDARK